MNNPLPESIPPTESSPTVTTAAIIDRLTQAATDLEWSSESDYPFELVTWAPDTAMTPTALFSDVDRPELPIESITLNDLFAPVIAVEDWYEAEELAVVDRYKVLLESIESNLAEVQVFRVGEVEIDIYIIGKTPAGDIVGLKTRSVET